jgi:hypothetical protein
MLVTRAYRYELDSNNSQRSSLVQHAGVARFAYNWGLEIDRDLYAALNLVAVSLPETENACGDDVGLFVDSLSLQRAVSEKQEPHINSGLEKPKIV